MRGTQSFVGVMSAVWKRPSLTGLELLWRWGVGIPTLALIAWQTWHIAHAVTIDLPALQAMTFFKPVQAVQTLNATLHSLLPDVLPVLVWLVPLALLARTAAAAFGRASVQRRLDVALRPKPGVLFVLSAIRTAGLLVFLALWTWGIHWANSYAILGPANRGAEPNVVLLFALAVFGTLALFVLWAAFIWLLDAAFVVAGEERTGVLTSLRTGSTLGPARSKFVEINLVSGIVKMALIVWLLVLSSCPLPFESVESTTFLAWWWAGVIVLYLAASDYFHVVRTAAYLALLRAYSSDNQKIASERKSAS